MLEVDLAALPRVLAAMAVAPALGCSALPMPAHSAPTAIASEYRLGPDDEMRVAAYQNLDFTLQTRETEAGNASHLLPGSIPFGGRSVTPSGKFIGDSWRNSNFVKPLQVNTSVVQVQGKPIDARLTVIARTLDDRLQAGDLVRVRQRRSGIMLPGFRG